MLTQQRKREIFKEEYTRNLKAKLTAQKAKIAPRVKEYICKYCGAPATTPEEFCYKNPNHKPE